MYVCYLGKGAHKVLADVDGDRDQLLRVRAHDLLHHARQVVVLSLPG